MSVGAEGMKGPLAALIRFYYGRARKKGLSRWRAGYLGTMTGLRCFYIVPRHRRGTK